VDSFLEFGHLGDVNFIINFSFIKLIIMMDGLQALLES
jgi:hypothetical protein